MFGAERDDEFFVCFFLTSFVQNAHMCLATIESFGGFAKAASETIVDEGKFEDAWEVGLC